MFSELLVLKASSPQNVFSELLDLKNGFLTTLLYLLHQVSSTSDVCEYVSERPGSPGDLRRGGRSMED